MTIQVTLRKIFAVFLVPRIAEALRGHGCASVKTEVIRNSAHYIVDEQPETVAELIERYAKG